MRCRARRAESSMETRMAAVVEHRGYGNNAFIIPDHVRRVRSARETQSLIKTKKNYAP